MKLDKATMHKIEWLIVFTALVVVCFFRFDLVVSVIQGIARLLTPFALGGAMAFGINLLMRFLERKLFGNRFAVKHRLLQKIRRPVSIALSVLIIFGVLAAAIGLVLPQLAEAVRNVAANLETAVPRLRDWLNEVLAGYPDVLEPVSEFLGQEMDWGALFQEIINFLEIRKRGGLAGRRFRRHRISERNFQQCFHVYDRVCVCVLHIGDKREALQPGVPHGTCVFT